jgi:5-methylcytosine-specific restriction endonuclease McrA
VDHIKPRSTHPKLALAFDNLQLLCEDCNIGKSNKCDIDWRPDEVDAERELVCEAMKHI